MVQAWRNLADVYLDAVAGNGTAIAMRHTPAPTSLGKTRHIVSPQHLVNRPETESDLVQPNQLVAKAFDPQATRLPQLKDQCDFLRPDSLARRSSWSPALIQQASDALCLVPLTPFPQCRARDAAAAADKSCVPNVLVQSNPAEALPLICGENVVRHGKRSILTE